MADPTDRVGAHPGSVLAHLDRPRAAERTRLAVIADPGWAPTRSVGSAMPAPA